MKSKLVTIYIFISVASLLSSLHQLKEENLDLEDSVDRMVQRRDHLLAVRARLLALSSLTVATPNNNGSQIGKEFIISVQFPYR